MKRCFLAIAAITAAMAVFAGPAGASLTGTTSVAAAGGIATFSNLVLDPLGSYTLSASYGTLSATSASFAIAAGPAAQLAFVQQPTSAVAGQAITPAPAVERRR